MMTEDSTPLQASERQVQLLNWVLCLGRLPLRVAQWGGGAHNTHTESKEPFYGASTKGLFAQWPFALQRGVAGTLGLELGHKHQTAEHRGWWKYTHVSQCSCGMDA